MDIHKRSLQIGAVAILCAVVLRLWGGVPEAAISMLSRQEVMSALLFLETGRVVRSVPQQSAQPVDTVPEQTQPLQTEGEATQPQPQQQTHNQEQLPPEEAARAVFVQEDAQLVAVNSVCGYETDLPELLQQPLQWDLTGPSPTVLILHTHGTESYTKTETYSETSAYRTLDEGYNVVSVGDQLAQILTDGGVQVLHDRTLHDYPSYSGSYNHARGAIEAYLEQYPSIALVLDIHRDSVEDSSGEQMYFAVQSQGESIAKLMMVVGTDASGLAHPDWPENMSLAVKLHAQLEKITPGICRPISFRSQRFNQDLSPGALIVEVGSAGNTRQEALAAAQKLGEAILALSHGTQ